ncbi:MAG TPA: precorrin-6A synthase (deacetylating) [Magnetospirillaceae bacterium]|jgi:precorrin-6A synthase
MKKILIIGIGAGNPDYITIQAVKALNRVDVFFLMDKGPDKAKLNALRTEICARYIEGSGHRFVDATSPAWERRSSDYAATIGGLNQNKQRVFEQLIAEEMQDGECAGILVWGDPALYDSTVRIIEAIAKDSAHPIDYEVIPGISSIQALAARHKTTLNRIGQSIAITTGRRLAEGLPETADSVVVMLDAHDTYKRFVDQDIDIYWGAYVGTEDEILIAGNLREVADDIQRVRSEARQRHGWIMDSYLMRKKSGGDAAD